MSPSNILLIMTGSIACYKICYLISKLTQEGHHVQIVATKGALEFVGKATLEGLSGRRVYTDLYEDGQMMGHIHLARWAHAIVIAPATANFINKIAQGLGDDLASSLILAHDYSKPFIIAPAMNTMMYNNPITQLSLKKLKDLGVQILSTESGALACGEVGEGRLLDPDKIHSLISKQFTRFHQNIKILITAGGTQIPIDDVRFITNLSTGKTGVELSNKLAQAGFDITLLRSTSSPRPHFNVNDRQFKTFDDLNHQLENDLSTGFYTHIIHLAAVSDYEVDKILVNEQIWNGSKLPSKGELVLKMKPTFKIVDRIRKYSKNSDIKIIAFKLTSDATEEIVNAKVKDLFDQSKSDWVVHNDLSQINSKTGVHRFTLFKKSSKDQVLAVSEVETIDELSRQLEKILIEDAKTKSKQGGGKS